MKQHYCFLERFNNYFNRKIIKYDSLLEYQNNSKSFFIPEDSQGAMMPFDFNPNDNVMTEIIANEVPFDPDYFLLLDDDSNIVQRWFVLEQKRNRQGQWLYQLRRDVISDNLDNLESAPIFVQKGMLKEDDPFIVNSEGMNLNQIKKKETLLKDNSGTAWLVGYIARNSGGSDITIQSPSESYDINYVTLEEISADTGISVSDLQTLLNFDESVNPAYITDEIQLSINTKAYTNIDPYNNYFLFRFNTNLSQPVSSQFLGDNKITTPIICDHDVNYAGWVLQYYIEEIIENRKGEVLSDLPAILNRYVITGPQYQKLRNYIGKIIKFNGLYYTFQIDVEGSDGHTENYVATSLYSSFTNIYNDLVALPAFIGTENSRINAVNSIETKVYFRMNSTVIDIPTAKVTISSGRNITADQEFDIIAMPLSCSVYEEAINETWLTDEQMTRRIASAIVLDENAKLYDLQLLPYCPLPNELIPNNNTINVLNTMTEHLDYDYITSISSGSYIAEYSDNEENYWERALGQIEIHFNISNDQGQTINVDSANIYYQGNLIDNNDLNITAGTSSIVISFSAGVLDPTEADMESWSVTYHLTGTIKQGILFYVKNASFQTVLNYTITSTKSKKTLSNCYMWRLVSPNYQGAFEFNIAKNGGSVNAFNVLCTYKPYTPFIKVAPDFTWLYGYEFGDNRGLICSGDFSMPRISSAWESYELQNKNYQNIFNRDIQHLDFMQGIEMRNQLVSGAVGILADTAKGAGAGAYVGVPYGALIGGTVGAVASGVGYGIDVDTLARTQRENKQLAIDKYNYQLGNIKALPYTLTTVGVFTAISKIFPFVEEYSCSDEEITAFENKIKWESMTVMRIGTLSEFMNFNGEINYFKGELIRNDEIADDSHVLNAIYEELLKGVYI